MARGTGPYLFQVGFNKCGTTSLYELFQRSGVPAMHGFLPKEHMAPMKQSRRAVIQRHVRKSVANPENPLGKLSRTGVRAFFDMELVSATECIENFRHFPVFARAYPDAIFLLNTRERDDWLRSRARHLDGTYLAAATTRLAKSEDEVLAIWADDFDGHHEAVRTFFRDTPERLVEFHITRDGID
ncbi:MAG: sulfotransferase, partial [Pseudomonadota bacterium]